MLFKNMATLVVVTGLSFAANVALAKDGPPPDLNCGSPFCGVAAAAATASSKAVPQSA
ncbi:hypothetical protein ACEQ8H_006958 [Pleosporales sp. CAS-2024a]